MIFLNFFLSNLGENLDDDEFVDSIDKLIKSNKLNKTNYFKVLK